MRRLNHLRMYILLAPLSTAALGAPEEISTKATTPARGPENTQGTVSYSFDELPENDANAEISYYSGIERMFKNPALQSGLASGTAAINRSIESLMESIFYSMLDNELVYDASDSTKFGVVLKRDVFNSSTGNYVVVDQFSLGPRYLQELGKLGQIPLQLKGDTNVNVYNIYPRSDGMRLAEKADLPTWRYFLNNWLGLLPLLTRILPPSFNPNELYDPITQSTTPFIFPLDYRTFYDMALGGIRSYSLTAGVSIPVDLANLLDARTKEQLIKMESLTAKLPISVFLTGEQRLSVLRKSEHVAWVGLNSVRRAGAGVSAELGRIFKVLAKVSEYWAGVDAPFFPIDFDFTKAKAIRFDHLYEFDLRNKFAQEAYKAATNGDFTVAHQRYLDQREQNIDTGVSFHFRRNEHAIETDDESGLNFFLFRKTRDRSRSEGEVEITDPDGKFYVLESRHEADYEQWEVLTGGEQTAVKDSVELRVNRVLDSENSKDTPYRYIFSATDTNPVQFTVSMNILDRHVDAEEYGDYLERLRRFTRLPLKKAPRIAQRSAERQMERRRLAAMVNPADEHRFLHVTPTYLGQFTANAAVVFNTDQIKQIASKSEDEMWEAFAKAFDKDSTFWRNAENRHGFNAFQHIIRSMALYPLRVFNIRSSDSDFFVQVKDAIDSLRGIEQEQSPEGKLEKFTDFLSNDYPEKMTEALLRLANRRTVPRSVTFFTKARGDADEETKKAFRTLDNQVIKSVVQLPPSNRHQIAEEKLSAFYPSQLKYKGTRPIIQHVDVSTELQVPIMDELSTVPSAPEPETVDAVAKEATPPAVQKNIALTLNVKNLNPYADANLYVRIENAGEVQVGRFVLVEQVVKVRPGSPLSVKPVAGDEVTFRLLLNGPKSPLTSMITDGSVDISGAIQIHLAASADGKLWSDERLLRFRYEDGRLMPLQ